MLFYIKKSNAIFIKLKIFQKNTKNRNQNVLKCLKIIMLTYTILLKLILLIKV